MRPVSEIRIEEADPTSLDSRAMIDALWVEIQTRYRYDGPNDIDPALFVGERSSFWLAKVGEVPIGCIGLKVVVGGVGELDAMFVKSEYRGKGVAQLLFDELKKFSKSCGLTKIELRSGIGQPESLRFYEKMGFKRVPCPPVYDEADGSRCYELDV